MKFVAAWRFLTIIPVLHLRENTKAEIGGSLAYFPVIGIIIGLVLALLAWLLNMVFPHSITDAFLVIILVVITGAIHIDGLADTFDGLGGKSTAEKQAIMKDSRHGTFGIAAIVLILLIKFLAILNLPQPYLLPSLIVTPMMGRWAMVYCVTFYPYSRISGLGTTFKETGNKHSLLIGSLVTIALSIFLFQWASIALILFNLFIVGLVAQIFNRIFTGLTGDNYGAVSEIAEISTLVFLVLLINNNWLVNKSW